MLEVSRRNLLIGLAGVIAAPAIVRASSLMPVKAWSGHDDLVDAVAYAVREPELVAWDLASDSDELVLTYFGDGVVHHFSGGIERQKALKIGLPILTRKQYLEARFGRAYRATFSKERSLDLAACSPHLGRVSHEEWKRLYLNDYIAP